MIHIPGQATSRVELINRSELDGSMQTVAIEDVGDKRIFHYAQCTGYITNANERRRLDSPDWNRKNEMPQVAAVPDCIWNLWESMGIVFDEKELRKALMRHKDEYMVVEKRLI